ncbi:MAG TPA: phospho-N-acetylmuramoyl-pentapeptide-transferase, partial [Candidatus Cloacimonadota bacterium]|nr:phospho-N-acetylmuramoyl-pentapeptide-transferase [Candidatus Cloacimonadota bacterium]
MLYHIFYPLAKYSIVFNVLRYVTFRSIGAFITALMLSLLFGPAFIRMLKNKAAVESIDEDMPEKHRIKQGTPTMGGLIILVSMMVSSLFWNILTNPAILMMYLSTVWLGILGFLDDYLKNFVKAKKGLIPRYKLWGQISIGLILTLAMYYSATPQDHITALQIPFFKDMYLELGLFFIPFVVFMITGSSNAVNLTDG